MEEFVTLFELFVGIEACNLSYNVVTTILNFRRNSALEEAQKSVNILSKRCNEMQSYYENLMTEKSASIRGLLCKIEKLQKQVKEKPADKCEGCNNAKGCVACVDGSEWAHIEEQNPAWSKEDEERLKETLAIIETVEDINKAKDGFLGAKMWIKSIKDRVLPQPNQEWSEDDEYNLAFIQEALLGLDGDGSYREKCCKMAEWLESLKDRVGCEVNCTTTKQWSEEDERERKRVVGLLEGWLSTFKETCYAEDCKCGIEWLRTLKDRVQPQNTWKPSDEQMKILSIYENVNDVLASLYQDLKKLKEE